MVFAIIVVRRHCMQLGSASSCRRELIKVNEFEIDFKVRRARKQRFYAQGQEISQWALDNGFPKALVYSVLSGRTIGQRGKAHLIAVKLGLKEDSSEPGAPATPSEEVAIKD